MISVDISDNKFKLVINGVSYVKCGVKIKNINENDRYIQITYRNFPVTKNYFFDKTKVIRTENKNIFNYSESYIFMDDIIFDSYSVVILSSNGRKSILFNNIYHTNTCLRYNGIEITEDDNRYFESLIPYFGYNIKLLLSVVDQEMSKEMKDNLILYRKYIQYFIEEKIKEIKIDLFDRNVLPLILEY